VLNNPVSYRDPSGLVDPDPGSVGGGGGGGCTPDVSPPSGQDVLNNNCDYRNPYSGAQGYLAEQLGGSPYDVEIGGMGCDGGESLGIPCGMPMPQGTLWDILGITPPNGCEFGPCDSGPAFGFVPDSGTQKLACATDVAINYALLPYADPGTESRKPTLHRRRTLASLLRFLTNNCKGCVGTNCNVSHGTGHAFCKGAGAGDHAAVSLTRIRMIEQSLTPTSPISR